MSTENSSISISFNIIKVIGYGNFGKVFLVRKIGGPDNDQVYALKKVKFHKNNLQDGKSELGILNTVKSVRFFSQMQYAFKNNNIYNFILDFEAGGDLHRRLKQTNGIPYGLGRLCLAEILLAIEYLHSQSIIVRDLKSENVLIDKHGHIVLADFGLAKHLKSTGRCYDRCGTMQYMAPEILSSDITGYSFEIDWWAYGCLLYEIFTNKLPFEYHDLSGNSKSELMEVLEVKIVHEKPNISELDVLGEHSMPATNLLNSLLNKNPAQRLGAGHEGSKGVKEHEFFKGLNWILVFYKQYKLFEEININSDFINNLAACKPSTDCIDDDIDDFEADENDEQGKTICANSKVILYISPHLLNTSPETRFIGFDETAVNVAEQKCKAYDVPPEKLIPLYINSMKCYVEINSNHIKDFVINLLKTSQDRKHTADNQKYHPKKQRILRRIFYQKTHESFRVGNNYVTRNGRTVRAPKRLNYC